MNDKNFGPRIGEILRAPSVPAVKYKEFLATHKEKLDALLPIARQEFGGELADNYRERQEFLINFIKNELADPACRSMTKEAMFDRLFHRIEKAVPTIEPSEIAAAIKHGNELSYEELIDLLGHMLPGWSENKCLANPKDYEIASGLAERLAHTEIRGVPQSELRLPFDVIRVYIPSGLFGSFASAFLYQHSVIGLHEGIFFFEPHLAITMVRKDDSTLFITLPLLADMDISEVKKQLKLSPRRGEALQKESNEMQVGLIMWLLNVVLYATSLQVRKEMRPTNAEYIALTARLGAAKGTKRESIKARRRSLDPGYRTFLGIGVPSLAIGTGNPLQVRTRVQGHWRMQAHGPKFSLRSKIWIEDFWKGPEFAPVTKPIRELV